MKIIYHCYGGAHSSVTAAAIHLGKLPEDILPQTQEFDKLSFYDWQTQKTHGQIFCMGTDADNHEIYILGRRTMNKIVDSLTYDLMQALNIDQKSIMVVDASSYVNLIMRIGGILSRRLSLVKIGKPIVIRGTLKAYPYLVKLVREVKAKVGSRT